MPVNESDQLLINELRRIERAIEKRKKALDALATAKGKQNFNRRYVLDVPLDIVDGTVVNVPVTRSFVVDRDCIQFCCREVVFTPAAVGTLTFPPPSIGSVTGKFSLPPTAYFWFDWQVRDTYSDRAWQSHPMPSLALGSGKVSGLPLGRPAVLPAGTEVLFTVQPLEGASATSASTRFTATSFSVQVSFVGYEVV